MIKVISGPMFSAKSDLLFEEYEKRFFKGKIMAFKPGIDTRDPGIIRAREKNEGGVKIPSREISAIIISDIEEIKRHMLKRVNEGYDISTILIDEGNFLKGDITLLQRLSTIGDIDIIIAGLNKDRFQRPFGLMPDIMAIADEIVLLTASCNMCNRPANNTVMEGIDNSMDPVFVGDKEQGFIAVCERCLRKKTIKEEGLLNDPTGNLSLLLKRPKLV